MYPLRPIKRPSATPPSAHNKHSAKTNQSQAKINTFPKSHNSILTPRILRPEGKPRHTLQHGDALLIGIFFGLAKVRDGPAVISRVF